MSEETTTQSGTRREIQRLLPRHHKILDLALAGHNPTAIAEIVGMSRHGVMLVLRSPLFQMELARRRKADGASEMLKMDRDATMGKAREILERASVAAAEKQEQLMNGALDESVQLRAANSILDRVFGKNDGAAGPVVSVTISAEHVQLLNMALTESMAGLVKKPVENVADVKAPE